MTSQINRKHLSRSTLCTVSPPLSPSCEHFDSDENWSDNVSAWVSATVVEGEWNEHCWCHWTMRLRRTCASISKYILYFGIESQIPTLKMSQGFFWYSSTKYKNIKWYFRWRCTRMQSEMDCSQSIRVMGATVNGWASFGSHLNRKSFRSGWIQYFSMGNEARFGPRFY